MTFKSDLLHESVRRLPLRDAIAIDSHTIVRAAVALMRSHALGCAVIVDRHCRPTGIFTEKSIIEMLVMGASLDSTAVAQFADPCFYVLREDEPIAAAWEAITRAGVRYLCVTDREGKLLGLSGQRGIAEYVSEYFSQPITVQRLGSAPWMLQREGA